MAHVLAAEAGLVVDDGPPIPLRGSFHWRISGPRTCIGRWDATQHVACPKATPVTHDVVCTPCSGLEHPECIFEPLCQREGFACTCPFGATDHVVYLAFYGGLAKLGMTQARRVAARLREQGADAYVVLGHYDHRGAARRSEQSLSKLHRIPQWRTWRETLPQMARPVEWERIEAKARDWVARLAPGSAPLLQRVHHEAPQPIGGRPERVQVEGEHAGTWLGRKGPYAYYAAAPSPSRVGVGLPRISALKLPDVVGRHLILAEPAVAVPDEAGS